MADRFTIENRKTKILVAGAGPAGASLAIRLAQSGFAVCLVERERFPRPKLCGEFISPECLRHFRELGVAERMLDAGGERIAETVFYAENGKSVGVPSAWFNGSEAGALSLSRAAMDFELLERARTCGVEVLEDCSVVGLTKEKDRIQAAQIRRKNGAAREIAADLFVDATGRARVLGKLAERKRRAAEQEATENRRPKTENRKPKTKLIGFKAHLENANPARAACEIYFFPGGYGGLSLVENGRANFCFLMRAETVKEFDSDVERILERVVSRNRRAALTLKNAAPLHEWLAVAVDEFGSKSLNPAPNLFAVGDAGAFIDPFTGSGMLLAFESAEIFWRAATVNSAAEQIALEYGRAHRRRFQKRLFLCSLIRRAAFAPHLAGGLIAALGCGSLPRKLVAQATRWSFSGSK